MLRQAYNYFEKVEKVCNGEIKECDVYEHESKIRIMFAKERKKKEKTFKEIFDDNSRHSLLILWIGVFRLVII